MKYIPAIIACALLLSSCEEGWTDEHKKAYKETCLTGSGTVGLNEAQRIRYCDCSLEKTMQHYQNITEVVENKDSTQMSAALKECYNEASK